MKVKLIVKGDDFTGQMSPDIISMRMGYFFYFKKAEVTIFPVTNKNQKEVINDVITGKKFPICYDEESGKYSDDLLEIERFYEKEYPEISLSCSDKLQNLCGHIFTNFLRYINNRNDSYLKRIQQDLVIYEEKLEESGGPYLNGEDPCLADCIIFPKIYHIKQFFEISKLFDIIPQESLPNLYCYYKMMIGLPNSDHLKSDVDSFIHYYRTKGVPPNLLKKQHKN
ncbi:Glutathione S-transferase DHAR2 [Thelohanellus kitauei]|uniref:Glutathione S-transferase DHAR2 n=1 Tax=Thelohanellus kitauei TaxID=669202 RepID=A0A0C2N6I1_THEKT|nr:Glutathione S-transferase DHAR2 [Thelohanellus kitauei]